MLKRVEKPGRYIGGEVNSVKKSPEDTDVNFCFCFPDIYEIGMSYLGLQILYKAVNDRKGLYCQRAFHPQEDMEQLMRQENVPLYTLETKTPLKDLDCIGFTLQYEMSFTTMLNMMDLSGIPVFSRERGDDMPLVIAGGPCATNPEPLWEFVDCFIIGDGEEALPDFLEELGRAKKNGMSKGDFLRLACRIPGVYVPAFYDVEYNEDGTILRYVPLVEEAPMTIRRNILPSIEDAVFPVDPIISDDNYNGFQIRS
ncbi:MAG: hypothetical protein IIZ05_01100 [Firmicutes bacterium]|nr:hypothetical protein [Bacillota bacterium]